MAIKGFIAYPSAPPLIGETIERAQEIFRKKYGDSPYHSWRSNDIAGRFLVDPIKEKIEEARCLVADITVPNFNVIYEIGYAIARGKRVILIRNTSISVGDKDRERVGIFDTLGHIPFSTSQELFEKLDEITDFSPLKITQRPDIHAPVFLLQPPVPTDPWGWVVSQVKQTTLRFKNFDPSEQPRLSANIAIASVASSFGAIVPLLSSEMTDASIHNFRAAFVAGLADGFEKVLLLVQHASNSAPLDVRDSVRVYGSPEQIEAYIGQFAKRIFVALQETDQAIVTHATFLEGLDLGAQTAENEFQNLGAYYVQTGAFRSALRGEVRIVTGRKGAGKTALFAQVRDHLRAERRRMVLDLRPEGFQLQKFKEQVLDFLEDGAKQHTITAFWEYLLLIEICYKILEKDQIPHTRDARLTQPYQDLFKIYGEEDFENAGDFSERMSRLVDRIQQNFEAKHAGETKVRLDRSELTEILYGHDLPDLLSNVTSYLKMKAGLWILFDNLDKGWPTHGLKSEDVLLIRCLLDAARKLERHMRKAEIECHAMIFVRNDVYELLIGETPDRGKEAKVGLDWTDVDLLKELVRRRIVYNDLPKDMPIESIWPRVCVKDYNNSDSLELIIDRGLMRPRFILNLLNYCKSFAINLGHEKILASDIEKGLNAYSTDLLFDIDLEIRDVFPAAENLLYVFIGHSPEVSETKLAELFQSYGFNFDDNNSALEFLLWYSVLGVKQNGQVTYIHSINYDMRRLRMMLRANQGRNEFYVHPAFWPGLDIRADA